MLIGDGTSFSLCPKTGKVITPKGYKNVYEIIVISANDSILPLMIIIPYLRPPKDIVNSMPDNWFLGRTESGWMMGDGGLKILNKNLRLS